MHQPTQRKRLTSRCTPDELTYLGSVHIDVRHQASWVPCSQRLGSHAPAHTRAPTHASSRKTSGPPTESQVTSSSESLTACSQHGICHSTADVNKSDFQSDGSYVTENKRLPNAMHHAACLPKKDIKTARFKFIRGPRSGLVRSPAPDTHDTDVSVLATIHETGEQQLFTANV